MLYNLKIEQKEAPTATYILAQNYCLRLAWKYKAKS